MTARRTLAPIAAAAVGLTALVAGCSSEGTTAPAPASSNSAPVQPAETQPGFSPSSTVSEAGFGLRVDALALTDGGAFGKAETFQSTSDAMLVDKRVIEGSWGDPDGQFQWQLFTGQSPEPIPITVDLESETEFVSSAVGLQQDPDSTPSVVVAAQIRQKASGLNAAADHLELRMYDFEGTQQSVTSVDWDFERPSQAVQSVLTIGGIVVARVYTYQDLWTIGVDLGDGALLWQDNCGDMVGRDLIGAPGVAVYQCGDATVGVDPASGERLWEVSKNDRTANERVSDPGQVDHAESPVIDGHVVVYGSNGSHGVLDIAAGTFRWGSSAAIDPAGGLIVIDYLNPRSDIQWLQDWPEDESTFDVLDLATGEALLQIFPSQRLALGSLHLVGAFDTRMWIWNADGLDVANARTGERDDLAPVKTDGFQHSINVPVLAGDTWVLMARTNGIGDAQPSHLVRNPAGGITAEDLPPSEVVGLQ